MTVSFGRLAWYVFRGSETLRLWSQKCFFGRRRAIDGSSKQLEKCENILFVREPLHERSPEVFLNKPLIFNEFFCSFFFQCGKIQRGGPCRRPRPATIPAIVSPPRSVRRKMVVPLAPALLQPTLHPSRTTSSTPSPTPPQRPPIPDGLVPRGVACRSRRPPSPSFVDSTSTSSTSRFLRPD